MISTASLQRQQCKGDDQGGIVEDSAVFSTSRPAPLISIAVISEQIGAIQRKIPIDAKSSCISLIESADRDRVNLLDLKKALWETRWRVHGEREKTGTFSPVSKTSIRPVTGSLMCESG